MQEQKEIHIQKAILDLLALKKCHCWRNNSGAFKDMRGNYVAFGSAGSPDIICVLSGNFVGLEVKRPGGKLSPAQEAFHAKTERNGGKVYVIHSVDEADAVLKQYGK